MSKFNGFTLIEVIVVVAIIAILMFVAIPRLARRNISAKRDLLNNLAALTSVAQANAIMTGKHHRIFFDLQERKVSIEIAKDGNNSDPGLNSEFAPLDIPRKKTSFELSPALAVSRFLIRGKEILASAAGERFLDLFFVINPRGICQEAEIEFSEDNLKTFSLLINPFTAKVSYG